jgi:hypothetical protein
MVGEFRAGFARVVELEPLDHVRDGTTNEPEVDALGRGESDRLDRHDADAANPRAVGGEDHVGAALEDLDLLAGGSRLTAEVRSPDHLEDELARGADRHGQRPEPVERPSPAEH